jgi:hypothetical protein
MQQRTTNIAMHDGECLGVLADQSERCCQGLFKCDPEARLVVFIPTSCPGDLSRSLGTE